MTTPTTSRPDGPSESSGTSGPSGSSDPAGPPARSRRSGGYAKGRARRAEIIDRASTHFAEAGYRGSSLREIAAGCGLTHTGLLHHFATKEALLVAVLEHRDSRDIEDVLGNGERTASGIEVLRRILRLVARNEGSRGIVELYCILSAEATAADHPAHDWFVHRYRTTVSAIERGYTEAADAGQLAPGVDPATAARELVALMDGLQLQWLLDDGLTPMARIVHDHVASRLLVDL